MEARCAAPREAARTGLARGLAPREGCGSLTRAALGNMITTRVLGFVGLGVSTVGQTLGGRARWSLVSPPETEGSDSDCARWPAPVWSVTSVVGGVWSPTRLPPRGLSAGYLVDPASSHMLVSKIKPCMSKYKRLYCETANGSLNQLWFI